MPLRGFFTFGGAVALAHTVVWMAQKVLRLQVDDYMLDMQEKIAEIAVLTPLPRPLYQLILMKTNVQQSRRNVTGSELISPHTHWGSSSQTSRSSPPEAFRQSFI